MNVFVQIGQVWPYIGFVCFLIFSSLAFKIQPDRIITKQEILMTALFMTMLGPIAIPIAHKMLQVMKK